MRPCRFIGHCEINLITRKFCPSCRLNKCFTVGMSTDLIRKEESTSKKRKYCTLDNSDLTVMVCMH